MGELEDRQSALLYELAKVLDELSIVLKRIINQDPLSDRYYTSEQIAAFLQVSTEYVQDLTKQGMPHYLVGKGYRFKLAEVHEWMQANFHLASRRSAKLSRSLRAASDSHHKTARSKS